MNRISSLQCAWCGACMCARLPEMPEAQRRTGDAPEQDARCSRRMLLPEPGGPSNKTGRVCGTRVRTVQPEGQPPAAEQLAPSYGYLELSLRHECVPVCVRIQGRRNVAAESTRREARGDAPRREQARQIASSAQPCWSSPARVVGDPAPTGARTSAALRHKQTRARLGRPNERCEAVRRRHHPAPSVPHRLQAPGAEAVAQRDRVTRDAREGE